MQHWELLVFFFIVAAVYASVGFGGGSSYLAIMALYALPFKEMRLTALICNIIVVGGGTWVYIQHKQVNWKKIVPIVILSVPMAFFGAKLKLSQEVFFVILGCSLLVASVLLWIKTKSDNKGIIVKEDVYVKDGLIGGAIGFLSGMVGIGGGIFLSPILNLTRWDNSKNIAATASVFILVNSIAGIVGQLTEPPEHLNYTMIGLLCVAVFIGGQIGSRVSSLRFNMLAVRRVTAILVFIAGLEVLNKQLHWLEF
jgi:uncharacterized membrane protein YfcA